MWLQQQNVSALLIVENVYSSWGSTNNPSLLVITISCRWESHTSTVYKQALVARSFYVVFAFCWDNCNYKLLSLIMKSLEPGCSLESIFLWACNPGYMDPCHQNLHYTLAITTGLKIVKLKFIPDYSTCFNYLMKGMNITFWDLGKRSRLWKFSNLYSFLDLYIFTYDDFKFLVHFLSPFFFSFEYSFFFTIVWTYLLLHWRSFSIWILYLSVAMFSAWLASWCHGVPWHYGFKLFCSKN